MIEKKGIEELLKKGHEYTPSGAALTVLKILELIDAVNAHKRWHSRNANAPAEAPPAERSCKDCYFYNPDFDSVFCSHPAKDEKNKSCFTPAERSCETCEYWDGLVKPKDCFEKVGFCDYDKKEKYKPAAPQEPDYSGEALWSVEQCVEYNRKKSGSNERGSNETACPICKKLTECNEHLGCEECGFDKMSFYQEPVTGQDLAADNVRLTKENQRLKAEIQRLAGGAL